MSTGRAARTAALLRPAVHSGQTPQRLGVQPVGVEAGAVELGADLAQDEAVRPGVGAEDPLATGQHPRVAQPVPLGPADPPQLGHPVQHGGPAALPPLPGVRMRVVRVRRADAAGEHGRLGGGEPLDRPPEVGQGGHCTPCAPRPNQIVFRYHSSTWSLV